MANQRIRLISLFIFALLLTLGCGNNVSAGPQAPDFTMQDLSGKTIRLSDYRGRVVVLDFWASWCPPCRMAMKELIELQEKNRNRGLVILGISLDHPKRMDDQELMDFVKEKRVNYPVIRFNRAVVIDYFGEKKISLPTLFVIDREGKIRDRHIGFAPGALEKSLEKVL
jgi:peroxiredoxin